MSTPRSKLSQTISSSVYKFKTARKFTNMSVGVSSAITFVRVSFGTMATFDTAGAIGRSNRNGLCRISSKQGMLFLPLRGHFNVRTQRHHYGRKDGCCRRVETLFYHCRNYAEMSVADVESYEDRYEQRMYSSVLNDRYIVPKCSCCNCTVKL